jgi:hypothetical protein
MAAESILRGNAAKGKTPSRSSATKEKKNGKVHQVEKRKGEAVLVRNASLVWNRLHAFRFVQVRDCSFCAWLASTLHTSHQHFTQTNLRLPETPAIPAQHVVPGY